MVQVRNAYGLRAISGGTACGKQGISGASKVPLMDKEESAVLSVFMKDWQSTWVSTPSAGI